VAVFVSALAPIAFGFVFEAGISIEAIMWTSSILMVAVTVPLALVLSSAASRRASATVEE
jgi:fumarate reductase subunit D